MATQALLTPEIRARIGKQLVFSAPEELGKASIRKFAWAIGETNPLYFDDAYARATRFGGIVAPPTLVCETWQYLRQPIETEAGIVERFGLSIPHVIRGGHAYEFFQPVRPDDVITATWTFADAYEKQGRSGRMLFLILGMTYTNQHSQLLAMNRETLIYRPLIAGVVREGSPVDHGNALVGECLPSLVKPISLASMVRYAAAVWDFIPLHYDVDYAQTRGFPSPPVDGQMLGAFLAQLVTDWSGAGSFLMKLDFRLREFVCPGDTLTCHGRVVAERPEHGKHLVDCELWIENQHGATVVAPAHATVARHGSSSPRALAAG